MLPFLAPLALMVAAPMFTFTGDPIADVEQVCQANLINNLDRFEAGVARSNEVIDAYSIHYKLEGRAKGFLIHSCKMFDLGFATGVQAMAKKAPQT